jgi:hypothetical protein
MRVSSSGSFEQLGGESLPYLWVPEWHPGGHGLHLHFAVGRYIKRSAIESAWGRARHGEGSGSGYRLVLTAPHVITSAMGPTGGQLLVRPVEVPEPGSPLPRNLPRFAPLSECGSFAQARQQRAERTDQRGISASAEARGRR